MGQLSDVQREEIWCILSDLLGEENNIDYSKLVDVDFEQLKMIFFDEVTLYCGPHYFAITPLTGVGFFHDEVVADLRAKMERRNKSIIARLIQKICSVFWRYFFREEWKSLVKGLEQYRQTTLHS
jgi:hypothetical protein